MQLDGFVSEASAGVARLPVSPSIAAGDVRSPRGGDSAAVAPEEVTSMQHPLMIGHVGGNERVDGEQVLDRLGEVLIALMPAVPLDDPFRPELEALACAVGHPLPIARGRLVAV